MIAHQLNNQPHRWILVGVIVAAFILRLSWVLIIWPNPPLPGGDALTYLHAGKDLAEGGSVNWTAMLALGPVYPSFLSVFYRLVPESLLLYAIRLCQAILDTAMCVFAFDLGRRLFNHWVGLWAAGLLAIDLRFITQVNDITTETLFIFLLVVGVWAFVVARESKKLLHLILAVGILMLAAFTRAIALPIPLLLTASLLLPRPTRSQALTVAGLIGVVVVGVAGWSIRQYQLTNQWVIISDGFGGNFWMGSRDDGQWHGNARFQAEINDLKERYGGRLAYFEDSFKTITDDPLAYGRLLLTKLAQAYAQPHGTVTFPGESLKELSIQVLKGNLSIGSMLTGDYFWPKLYIYLFHFFGLLVGLIGLWLTRHEWLKVLPISLPIIFVSLTYMILTLIPRYLFPIMPFYMLFAAYTTWRLISNQPRVVSGR